MKRVRLCFPEFGCRCYKGGVPDAPVAAPAAPPATSMSASAQLLRREALVAAKGRKGAASTLLGGVGKDAPVPTATAKAGSAAALLGGTGSGANLFLGGNA